jgi:anti-anti-sigma factor
MQLMVDRVDRVSVLAVEGHLTVMTAVAFLRQIRRAMGSTITPVVALDLSRLHRIDSSGCAALLSLRRDIARRRGQLCLFGLGAEVRLLIEIMQAHVLLDIAPDLAGALESLGLETAAVAEAAGTPGWNQYDMRSNPLEHRVAS